MNFTWFASAFDPATRPVALRFALGSTLIQVLWVARMYLLDGQAQFATFFVLAALEVLVPVWAESRRRTAWHPHHIAERYGLFTLLLLGESLLASANAVIDALAEGEHVSQLLWLAGAGLAIVAGMWWIYFARDQAGGLTSARVGFSFGYLHFAIFAAAGAVSSGVEVGIDAVVGHTEVSAQVVGLSLTVPVALFVGGVWMVALRPRVSSATSAVVLGAPLLLRPQGWLPRVRR